MGFAEEGHHVRPKWLLGADDGPRVPSRMGLHRGAETGMHQQLNSWIGERGVIPKQFINNRVLPQWELRECC